MQSQSEALEKADRLLAESSRYCYNMSSDKADSAVQRGLAVVDKIRSKKGFFPRWEMPSDPVKAVWWLMHWLLRVLVRFFWLPIIGMIIYEMVTDTRVAGLTSGLIVGLVTLLIGLGVWAALYVALVIVNFWVRVSRLVDAGNQAQQRMYQGPFSTSSSGRESNDRVVEGSISEVEEGQQQQARSQEKRNSS